MASKPQIIFGTASWNLDNLDFPQEVVQILQQHGVTELDTARIYGTSEDTIGKLGYPKHFTINTKFDAFHPGASSYENILKSQKTSFALLGVDKVNIYFLHGPDTSTPIADTLRAINELHQAGKFTHLGLSNFTAAQVQEAHDVAKQNNYVLPTVYQGNYNPVARHIETDIFPLLRKLNIRFHAYSAIAGGFLSKGAEEIASGGGGPRFDPSQRRGKMYTALYNRPKLIEGLATWGNLAKENDISGAELAYRFMAFHSQLKGEHGDGIILGASRAEQVSDTLGYLEKGPLDKETVEAIEGVWEHVKSEAPVHNTDVM